MKCNKCNGEMTQLLTSFFCPKCEGGGDCCSKGNCSKDAAINKLDKDKKDDCGGSCGGSCGGYPGGHSLHSVKEDYTCFGPISSVSIYHSDSSRFIFKYFDPSMRPPYDQMQRIIHKHTMTSGCLAMAYALENKFEHGYSLYYEHCADKFHIIAPKFYWDSDNKKWVKGK